MTSAHLQNVGLRHMLIIPNIQSSPDVRAGVQVCIWIPQFERHIQPPHTLLQSQCTVCPCCVRDEFSRCSSSGSRGFLEGFPAVLEGLEGSSTSPRGLLEPPRGSSRAPRASSRLLELPRAHHAYVTAGNPPPGLRFDI